MIETFKANLDFDVTLEQLKTNILGQEVLVEQYKVYDNHKTYGFWESNKVYNSKEQAMDYVNDLVNCNDIRHYRFIKWCANHGVKEGSIVEFENKTQGIILGYEHADVCLRYSPFKKDKSPSKLVRNIYGNMKFKVIKY